MLMKGMRSRVLAQANTIILENMSLSG